MIFNELANIFHDDGVMKWRSHTITSPVSVFCFCIYLWCKSIVHHMKDKRPWTGRPFTWTLNGRRCLSIRWQHLVVYDCPLNIPFYVIHFFALTFYRNLSHFKTPFLNKDRLSPQKEWSGPRGSHVCLRFRGHNKWRPRFVAFIILPHLVDTKRGQTRLKGV